MEGREDNNFNSSLLHDIATTYISGKTKAVRAVNSALIETYWQIGKHIVDYEQGGNAKAVYGVGLLEALANDLAELWQGV